MKAMGVLKHGKFHWWENWAEREIQDNIPIFASPDFGITGKEADHYFKVDKVAYYLAPCLPLLLSSYYQN